MSKSRIFRWLLLAFLAGVGLRSFFAINQIWVYIGILLAAAAIILGVASKKKVIVLGGFRPHAYVSVGACLLIFCLGIFRFSQISAKQPDLQSFLGKPLILQGTVWEEPESKEKTASLKIKIFLAEGQKIPEPFFVLVTAKKYPEYKLGDELKIIGLLEKPENFNEFDYVSYLAKEDVYAVSYIPHIEKTGEGDVNWLKKFLSETKNSFEEKIDLFLPEPHAAFLKGLLLGEKQSLPDELVEGFKKTGTSHIVALSGYNITMVARFFLALLATVYLPFFISFWVAAAGIIIFTLMTGASASVVRAAIMGILVLISRQEGRLYNITNALVFAGALMVFQNPRVLRFDVAFQLSFLATIGLVYLAPQLEKFWERAGYKIKRRLNPQAEELAPEYAFPKITTEKTFNFKKTLVETLSAQIMVLPLLIYSFGQVSLISPLTNILVLAAVPYSMGLGFLAGVLGFFSEALSQILGYAVWILLEYQIRIIEIFSGIFFASVGLGAKAAGVIIILYVLVFWKMRKWFK